MKKLIFSTLILLAIVFPAFAETPPDSIPNYNYLALGTSINLAAAKDQLNTSLSYTGITFGSVFEFYRAKSNRIFYLGNVMSSGNLHPYKRPNGYSNTVQLISENFQMRQQWLVYNNSEKKFLVYFGPEVNLKLGMRISNAEIGNSGITYEAALSLGAAVNVDKYFSIDPIFRGGTPSNWKIGCSLSHPLLSTVFTPPYIGLPENLLQENALIFDVKSNYSTLLTRYVNLQANLSLTYFFNNRNGIEFSYLYDYTATYPDVNPAKTLNRMAFIKLLYNF